MGFILEGLDAEAYDRSYSDAELVRRITRYFRPHARTMTVIIAMVVLASLAGTGTPLIIARGIDLLSQHPALQVMLALAAGAIVFGTIGWFFHYIRQFFSARAVGDVVLALREDVFKAVMQRDLSFYDHFASGRIVSRVTSDTQDFATVATLTIDLISQLLLVVIIIVVL